MSERAGRCCICSQIRGDRTADLISLSIGEQRYVRRVPLETAVCAVIPSLGPIAPGHSLVCPKRHVRSMARLESDEAREAWEFRAVACEVLRRMTSAPVHIFEHGAARCGGRTLCTVDHAHLHLLPADVDVVDRLASELPWRGVEPCLEAIAAAVGDGEYLYYETPDGRSFVLPAAEVRCESQYLRRVFAEALGLRRHWNWRRAMALDEVERTFAAFAGAAREADPHSLRTLQM